MRVLNSLISSYQKPNKKENRAETNINSIKYQYNLNSDVVKFATPPSFGAKFPPSARKLIKALKKEVLHNIQYCPISGRKFKNFSDIHADHIVAEAIGGPQNISGNCLFMSATANKQKYTTPLSEYIRKHYEYDRANIRKRLRAYVDYFKEHPIFSNYGIKTEEALQKQKLL